MSPSQCIWASFQRDRRYHYDGGTAGAPGRVYLIAITWRGKPMPLPGPSATRAQHDAWLTNLREAGHTVVIEPVA